MTNLSPADHPITPPPELIRKWNEEAATAPMADQRYIATQAARWGADQELEACCQELPGLANFLRAARRPKPPSLKEQALRELADAYDKDKIDDTTYDTIRRALEALND